MTKYSVKLSIADLIVKMQSSFPIERFDKEEERLFFAERYTNFYCDRRLRPHILIDAKIVNTLPRIGGTEHVFTTYHSRRGKKDWHLLKKGNKYIYESLVKHKEQLMLINETFDRATAYLLPKKHKGWVWSPSDIIYDFLQVLLIQYLALRKKGVFVHAIGVRDLDGRGFIFAGRSGGGKTTTAKLWHNHTRAMVLNDDRVIVRKIKGKFMIYGSPWHGAFNDYLSSRIESAPLDKFFFLCKARNGRNSAMPVYEKEAFKLLYTMFFPTFWDKRCLENIVSFSHDMVEKAPCFRLDFAKDKRVINFVRALGKKK